VFCVTAEEHGGTAPTARPRVQPPESPQIQDKPSVAVLAFNNISGDSEQEYFSHGISEDIITDLSKVSGLQVIARNSSFVYKGAAVSIPQVAEELGVRYLLEGSVCKAGNRVRVAAQLVDSTNGGHIWADRFDRDLTDIFDVQDELTREIVSALELTLNAGDRDRLAHKRMVDIEAYNLFLRGREHTWLHSRQGNIAAREILARAVEITPGFAAAHARIAFTHVIDYANGWAEDRENSLRVGLELARRAVEMDEGEPQSHFSLSVALLWSREHTPALAEALRCIELEPNSAEGYLVGAHVYIFGGDATEAIEMIDTYMTLDPMFPDILLHFLAEAHISLRQFDQAVDILKRRLEKAPESATSSTLLAACYGHLGKLEESRAAWANTQRINPEFSLERRRRVLPFKDPADFELRIEGLRMAGIVD
jgi:adenylate cyclase